MKDTKVVHSGGIGFLGALTILFTGLKLTGHIGWSWWWVTAPMWLPVAIFVGIILIVLLGITLWTALSR